MNLHKTYDQRNKKMQFLQNNVTFFHKIVCILEMGQMSDYDIRPKPKVWAGSPNECQTFGRMLCARMKQRLLLVSTLSG